LAHGVRAVVGLHRRQPVDVLHALWADEPGAVAVLAGRVLGRPVVVSVLGGELAALPSIRYGAALGRGGRWTTRLALSQARSVTAGSEQLLDQLRSRGLSGQAHLTPLGVDLVTFSPGHTTQRGDSTVLLVGSLTQVKDPVTVIRSFARVAGNREDARLSVVGDGPLRPGLERLAGVLGVAGRIEFAGPIPRAELPARYRSAAMLAIGSLHEAQSMVVCEAAACGTPVVGSSVGVIPELANAGGALATEPGDVEGLARGIGSLLDQRELRAEMGTSAREHAERAWGLDGTVEAWDGLYHEVVVRRSA
jgi:glycosyltransferase involved in cell wall biosynthesis